MIPFTAGNSIVPTIDISAIDEANLVELDRACRDHGFFLLSGHGLDQLIEETWEMARSFFALSFDQKRAIERDQENPMGWFDRELTKGKRDHKEIFDFTDPATELGRSRNQWPVELPAFEAVMTVYHQAFSDLAQQTTALVLRALNIGEATSKAFCGDPTISPVRLNKYLVDDPVPEYERLHLAELSDVALGAHTDPGILTLLLQDGVGGLQTQINSGEWVDVVPTPGTIVINIGDTMQVWTNDQYRAANHRVLPMKERIRMSIPFFLHPPRNKILAPIDVLSNGQPKYRPFPWREYIRARDNDNYKEIGAADKQITDYRI